MECSTLNHVYIRIYDIKKFWNPQITVGLTTATKQPIVQTKVPKTIITVPMEEQRRKSQLAPP